MHAIFRHISWYKDTKSVTLSSGLTVKAKFSDLCLILNLMGLPCILNAKQKHLGCKKGEANQKQQLSDYKYTHSYTCD